MRVEGAGHPCEETADHEGQELVGGDVHPERLREVVGQPDALPGQPEPAPLESPQDEEGDDGQAHDEVVLAVLRRQGHPQQGGLGNAGEPAVSAGERHPERGDEADHLDERHRHHREVHPAQPERRIAHGQADDGGQERPAQQRQLERQRVVLGEERGRVGPDAHERRVADVELAAHERRAQARGQDNVGEDQGEHVDVVVAEQRHQERQPQHGNQDGCRRAPTHDRRVRSA